MQFAIACLIATTSAIRIQTSTCPTESASETTTLKYQRADGCWYATKKASQETCPSTVPANASATEVKGSKEHQHTDGCWYAAAE